MQDIAEKDIIQAADATKRLIQDEQYYKYIFKKTEKIVSVVFYILHNATTDSKTAGHIEDVSHAARQAHDAIIASLESRTFAAEDAVRAAALALIGLESKMRVAHVAGLITPEIMSVLHAEIDSVLRTMNKYFKRSPMLGDDAPAPRQAVQRAPRPQVRAATSSASPEAKQDRRMRIRTVLETKGAATIRDIAAIINDCGEKTLQRELNAMILDNVVQRQGERRWSTYSLV